tara:strand:+ start:8114 stop:9400 length:1287 start_codon:yes stop_codon:yes gene_type:complete
MEQWRNYRILIGILLLGFSTSCEKSEIDDIDDIINNQNEIPQVSPTSQYKTSLQNHEWNDGWYSHTDVNSAGLQAQGSLTYFDYGNDGDMDVFVQIEAPSPQYFNTWIIENKGTSWKKRKDVISEILPSGKRIPSGGRKMTQSDIDNDGDTDFVFFIADDDNTITGGGPGGGIFAFIYDSNTHRFSPIEIEAYQAEGNEYFYHGGTLGDVNGDGLVDIIAGTVDISVWINKGDLIFEKQELNVYQNSFICSSTIFDINQDGYLDLIVSDSDTFGDYKSSRTFGYILYGIPTYPYFDKENKVELTADRDGPESPRQYDCLFDVSITDWDNDGDYDLFTSGYTIVGNDNMSFLINYFENTSKGLINKTTDLFYENQNEGIINNSGLIKAWDIDNDGNKELLIEASTNMNSTQQGWNSFKIINGKLTRTNL